MNEIQNNIDSMGWNIQNSYLDLPQQCYAKTKPSPFEEPYLLLKNEKLAEELSLSFDQIDDMELSRLFCGNVLLEKTTPIAMAYAGHQFGNFTMLGDGRAHLLFEHIKSNGQKVDVQLKGSGLTPFSRGGDGKGALGPMLREYLISEAMFGLGIPTTRSLAVVTTGETIFRRSMHPGAVLTRIASSHIRVGNFQYLIALQDIKSLKQFADYTIERHYPELVNSNQPYLDLLEAVLQRQIDLVVNWMRVGFIHGVMNTDNMAISGETIDYGPCAFMDNYDPLTVFSSIDHGGRYAFTNQAPSANWNLARFAETLMPLIDENSDISLKQVEPLITSFGERFGAAWLDMMRKKLGLFGEEKEDAKLIQDLLDFMSQHEMDYTNTFRHLISDDLPDEKTMRTKVFMNWWSDFKTRQSKNQPSIDASHELMKNNNPVLIPRNHNVENALELAELKGDLSAFERLLDALSNPYDENDKYADLREPSPPQDRVYQTFCGT